MGVTEAAGSQARRVANSRAFDRLARLGLVCRGVLYLLIGSLALQISFGGGGREADESGAIATLAGQPFGTAMLWLMLVGFAALALWQLTEAAIGSGGTTERVEAAARTVVYGVLVASLANLLLAGGGPESGDQHAKDLTATALGLPAGQLLVGAAGLGVLGLGLYWLHKGLTRGFRKDLHTGRMSPRTRSVVTALGVVGFTTRAVIAGLAAVFLVRAAIEYEPEQAKGLDATLRSFADTAAGPWLLTAVALGLLVFAAYCMCEARWRRV
jgi:hypothetical protein